ncbi:MAG: glycosyltransferase [Pseudarcicella sp.]|nr:glycosyltransferase [Pseudarcicella sp.]
MRHKPLVTIWIAARNEELNILNALTAMSSLNYPVSSLQILIGDDLSTDKTAQIVRDFIQDKPHFELIHISKTINNQRGKANVLANLYEHSQGEYFLISDADVTVNPDWVNGMIQSFEADPKIGHQVGITALRYENTFHCLQSLDWMYALTLLKKAADMGIALTGLGNNSGITRLAYESTGGYAKIPFSITEDFALFHEVVKQDFGFHNAINQSVYAQTEPIFTIKDFLHQRKRWMVGALQCPWWIVILLFWNAFFIPILGLLACFFSVKIALIVWLLKWLNQSALMLPTLLKINQKHLIKHLFLYEIYSNAWAMAMVLFYYLPIKIDWKGRIYE